MWQMAIQSLYTLLSLIFIHHSSMEIFIIPSENATCQFRPCLTLNEFARNPMEFISENSTLIIFSPGKYHLHHQLHLKKVSNVVLVSFNETDDNAVIVTDKSVNIMWTDCNNITIKDLIFTIGNEFEDSRILRQIPILTFKKTNGSLSHLYISVLGYTSESMESTASIEFNSSHFEINDMIISNIISYNKYGGVAVSAYNSILYFDGVNKFKNNAVLSGNGGALQLHSCSVIFSGQVFFVNNTSESFLNFVDARYGGGAVYSKLSTIFVKDFAIFLHNRAITSDINVILDPNLQYRTEYNFVVEGGAIYLDYSSTVIFETTSTVAFIKNIAHLSGGAIASVGSELIMDGKTSFQSNAACIGGGALSASWSKIKADGALFEMNFVDCKEVKEGKGGAIHAYKSNVTFSGFNKFSNNRATLGGASYYVSSLVVFKHFQIFKLNFADQGGAIAFNYNSKLTLNEPLQADFINNSAKNFGGAIFFEDALTISKCTALNRFQQSESSFQETCFIALNLTCKEFENTSNTSDIQLNFVDNTAGSAGTILYGGNLDSCSRVVHTSSCPIHSSIHKMDNAIQVFQRISYIVSNDSITSTISSDPLQVCVCSESGDISNCHLKRQSVVETVRGKDFTRPVVTVGQNKGIVPSFVRTSLENDVQISAKHQVQHTGKKCTPLTYHVFSAKDFAILVLFPDGPCRDTGISRLSIVVKFLPCPGGFSLRGSECVREERLQKYTTNCSVNEESIERLSNTFWMGVLNISGNFKGLILHSSCPLDYCMDTPVYIKINDLDIQCNHNHVGTLCGSCNTNYSIAFGTLHCLACSNGYLALLIPFSLAGIALVIILLLLQLTVASGTMNGLIFYVNVIQASRATFFTPGDTNILTVFIAWMNLDLGIETCFYDGMSVYVFTWLQFLFPFYVWLLIFLIIKLSRYSRRIAQIFGTNPVSVLATLFLLSYSKILRAIILALSTTSLKYTDGTLKQVWLYDGSVPYFQRADHIVLGAFAIVILLLLFLPYTLLLLFGHFLQAYSHWRILSWLNKIKPFMDAYHAPYKKETRYWTGLTLLLRCALFLTFALTSQGNNLKINLVVITSISAGLATLAWMHRGIYEKLSLDILESCFILNLCVFAVATYHVNKSMQRQN